MRSLALLLLVLLVGCGAPGSQGAEDAGLPKSPPEAPKPKQPEVRPPELRDLEVYTRDIPGEGGLHFMMETTVGVIECELFERQSPKAVANFVGLSLGHKPWIDPETKAQVSGQPFYEGVPFHRVMQGFVIQAGDRTGTGRGGPGYTFVDETNAELKFDRPGVLAMANTGPNSNGSQFFITERSIPHLNGRHTIFGQCKNIDVIRTISASPASNSDRPEKPPVIKNISFIRHP